MEIEEIREMILNENFIVIFPKEKERESAAEELAEMVEGARAIASFKEDSDIFYGVVVEKTAVQEELDNGQM